jgi:diguanylate cyclase (GGDEF)-like protein
MSKDKAPVASELVRKAAPAVAAGIGVAATHFIHHKRGKAARARYNAHARDVDAQMLISEANRRIAVGQAMELADQNEKLIEKADQLKVQANTDPLTGLANRRGLEQRTKRILEVSRRYKTPTSVVMFDLDGFKQINDTHGHDAGDHVLVTVADILKTATRSADIFARTGGEEFVMVLPETSGPDAVHAAENVRQVMDAYRDPNPENPNFTASFGVVQMGAGYDLDASISEADTELYNAKRNGRNVVSFEGQIQQPIIASDDHQIL